MKMRKKRVMEVGMGVEIAGVKTGAKKNGGFPNQVRYLFASLKDGNA